MLYPYIQAHMGEADHLFAEGSHLSARGHGFVADSSEFPLSPQLTVVVDYLLDQACRPPYTPSYTSLGGSVLLSTFDPLALPPLRIRQRLGSEPLPDPTAFCLSTNVDTPAGWQLQAYEAEGFTQMEWHDKRYWGANDVGARITFADIEVSGGFMGVYYLRSDSLGMGNLRCWPDDDEGKSRVLVGQWGYVSVGSVGVVAEGVERGRHNLTCVVDASTSAKVGVEGGPHKVRIIAVIAS